MLPFWIDSIFFAHYLEPLKVPCWWLILYDFAGSIHSTNVSCWLLILMVPSWWLILHCSSFCVTFLHFVCILSWLCHVDSILLVQCIISPLHSTNIPYWFYPSDSTLYINNLVPFSWPLSVSISQPMTWIGEHSSHFLGTLSILSHLQILLIYKDDFAIYCHYIMSTHHTLPIHLIDFSMVILYCHYIIV